MSVCVYVHGGHDFFFFFLLQFMGQDLTADFTVSSEPKFCDPLPSFRIYAEHYLICWSIGRKGCVCVCVCGGGVCLCFQWLLKTGHSVRLQIAWADAALCGELIFYHQLVLYTSDIKPLVQSCLKKVRRGACGIISLCISHIIEPLSFPAKTNTEAAFQQ